MDIKELLSSALSAARTQKIEAESQGQLHRRRSSIWVECLADQFRTHYEADAAVRVFSRGCYGNRREFGLNEFLYDVCVCRVASIQSSQGRTLLYVREVLWQAESEFAKMGREAIKDFSKLVCGSGRNKLFVGPHVADKEGFINVLLPAASACTGQVFVALLPHPQQWGRATGGAEMWKLTGGDWVPLP